MQGLYVSLIDTLALAREAFPGKRNNLDALCERFGVSNAHRTLHGALLDAQLLADVYLAMTRGQESLTIDMGTGRPGVAALGARVATQRPPLAVSRRPPRSSRRTPPTSTRSTASRRATACGCARAAA